MSKTKKITTQADLEKVLSRIPGWNGATVCSLIGHSRISIHCFGYRYCARCEALVGDSLGSIDTGAEQAVIVGHNCPTCRANFEKLTWQDKVYAPDPFAESKAEEVAQ